jgi:hypothetical protein
VYVRQSFVADRQTTEAVDPGKGTLNHPAVPPEPLAGLDPASGDAALDATPTQVGPTAREVVALVRMQLVGSLAWAAARPLDWLDGFDQVFEDDRVVDVGGREPDREWDALAVDQEVSLRARFAAVRRVGTDLLVRTTPLFAGTLEASRLARDQSIESV